MATYGPADAVFKVSTTAVPDVTEISSDDLEALTEEITPFGVAYEQNGYIGVKKLGPVTVTAPYSTTAGNLTPIIDAVGIGGTAACIIVIGGTKTTTFSAIVQKISRNPQRGAFTKYTVTLLPTGTITEA